MATGTCSNDVFVVSHVTYAWVMAHVWMGHCTDSKILRHTCAKIDSSRRQCSCDVLVVSHNTYAWVMVRVWMGDCIYTLYILYIWWWLYIYIVYISYIQYIQCIYAMTHSYAYHDYEWVILYIHCIYIKWYQCTYWYHFAYVVYTMMYIYHCIYIIVYTPQRYDTAHVWMDHCTHMAHIHESWRMYKQIMAHVQISQGTRTN